MHIATPLAQDLVPGASIAVNGACLTVEKASKDEFSATLMPETLEYTTLESLKEGDDVNLEPSLKLGDEVGGHFVFGHVDGVGHITSITQDGSAKLFTVEVPEELTHFFAVKGSVALDGVSLTLTKVEGSHITVSLVKHTLENTTLGNKKEGDALNVEVDMLARYAQQATLAQ